MIRVLGKGITAQAVKDKFDDVILYDENDFSLYDCNSNDVTVVSPGIPPHNNMVQNSKNIISDYDLFADNMPFSIWISGTNGKTTTTQMIQHLLESKGSVCGGNIGVPISSLDENAPIWILETSSFTNHYIKSAAPNLYVLLPISEDHITWHGSYEQYVQDKLKPLDNMKEGDIAIIPSQYKQYKTNAHIISYDKSLDLSEEFDINMQKVDFKEPFLLDALLSLACQKIIFDEVSYTKINDFIIDKHKVEEFKDKQNRLWVDDSKATNVDATIKALIPYKEKKIYLILGGDDKGANLEPLFEEFKQYNIELFSIGSNKNKIEELSSDYFIKCTVCKNLEDSVNKISTKLLADGVCMLSPSASSLDEFSSYKQRGEEFKKYVNNLRLN